MLYAPDTVTIAIVVRTGPGDQDCQGNSPEPVLVDLSEPLGSRLLFDGSSYPAQGAADRPWSAAARETAVLIGCHWAHTD